jgi:hypothetical protein
MQFLKSPRTNPNIWGEPMLQGGETLATPRIFELLQTSEVLNEGTCKFLYLATPKFVLGLPKSFKLAAPTLG